MKKRNKIKNIYIFIILIVVVIILGIIIYFINKDNVKVTLSDNLNIEANSEVKVSSLIKNIKDGSLVEDKVLDTSKLGKNEVTIKIKSNKGKTHDYSFDINVIDKEKPVISGENKIVIYLGDEVDFNDYFTITDNYDKDLVGNIVGEYDNSKEGEYNLKYVVKDTSGNEEEKEFTLKVEKSKYKRMSDKTITTSKGYTLKIKNGVAYIDGILIANKTYYLPEDYTPVDSYAKLTDRCLNCLEKPVMEAFKEMKADASNLGLNLFIVSGYRSYTTQKYLYNNYVAVDGKEAADTYSARAGYSEHQTGLAFDLNSVDTSFANTNEGKWINENCYKYGYIIRYPKGKDDITGYIYEPWHLRYVGKELAKKVYNNGNWLTLEEYFGITSKYAD